MHPSPDIPLFCHRCGRELSPGLGNFYAIRIEAVADPTGPVIDPDQLGEDLFDQMDALIEQVKNMSPSQLMDQVYRRMTIFLCGPCYFTWIEDPTGGVP